jgi:hypothetical protein
MQTYQGSFYKYFLKYYKLSVTKRHLAVEEAVGAGLEAFGLLQAPYPRRQGEKLQLATATRRSLLWLRLSSFTFFKSIL